MSTVGGQNVFGDSSRWQWGRLARVTKDLATAGTIGAGSILTHIGSQGLKVTGILKAANDSELRGMEANITHLIASGAASNWTDDMGRSGSNLQLTDYNRGKREYHKNGVWQHYTVMGRELSGAPDGLT